MSTRGRSLIVVLVVLALLCLAVGPAAAGSKTYFTGTQTWTEDLEPGESIYPDGRWHLRGGVSAFAFEGTDPRIDAAEDLITINWNFRWMPEPVFVSGPMWGTFVLTNDGGYWEGSWTGVRDENGFSYFHFVGHGGGGYDGLELRMSGERLDPYGVEPESYQGYILETGG